MTIAQKDVRFPPWSFGEIKKNTHEKIANNIKQNKKIVETENTWGSRGDYAVFGEQGIWAELWGLGTPLGGKEKAGQSV